MNQFTRWLESQHQLIMTCESEAMAMLAKDDISGYRAKMHEKAELLASLAQNARPELTFLPASLAGHVKQRLLQFSDSAATALALDSPFYMSALLYRDDHKKGEPDNLAIFIQDLKQKMN